MHSCRDHLSNLYIYSCSALLAASAVAARVRRVQLSSSAARVLRVQLSSSAARVRRARLRVANTAARLVLADTRRKVIVVCAKLAGAIGAHPAAARSSANLKCYAAIRA